MNTLRRGVASLFAWWVRLFLLTAVTVAFLSLPWWVDLPVIALLLWLACVRPAHRDDHAPLVTAPPVQGRWAAINSPGSQVPSHGIRAYGQAFAIDIAHPRPAGTPPTLGWGLRQRRPEEYPCFGEAVYAVRPGTVVTVRSRMRDHRARSTWPGILYMMTLEAFGRELGGAGFVVGNHIVLDHGDGVYSLYAHLQRSSATVRVGDRVDAGHRLGVVGNSGNTSEPHLHFQLMDDRRPAAAAGLPFRWTDIEQNAADTDPTWSKGPVSSDITNGLPANGQVFTAHPRGPRGPRTQPV